MIEIKVNKDLSILTYNPPKSNSHGHAVRDRNIKRALTRVVDTFVNNLNVVPNDELQVTIYYYRNDEKELALANNTISYLEKYLGEATREWINPGYEYMKDTTTWVVKGKNSFGLLEHLEQINPDKILPLKDFWISSHYSYRDEDKLNTLILTTLMCSIESGRLFVRIGIMFPYTTDDERLYQLLKKFSKELPFKLSEKHFRRLGRNANGKYGRWKLDSELQEQVNSCLE